METKASVKTKCDGCGSPLGDSWPNKRGSMSLSLLDGQDANGYDVHGRYDYCNEACLRTHLNKRSEKSAKASASVAVASDKVELDVTSSDVYKKLVESRKQK